MIDISLKCDDGGCGSDNDKSKSCGSMNSEICLPSIENSFTWQLSQTKTTSSLKNLADVGQNVI